MQRFGRQNFFSLNVQAVGIFALKKKYVAVTAILSWVNHQVELFWRKEILE